MAIDMCFTWLYLDDKWRLDILLIYHNVGFYSIFEICSCIASANTANAAYEEALRLRESRARVVAPEWLRHEEVKIASEEGIRTGAATLQKSGQCFGLSDTRNYQSVRAKSQLRSASQSMLSPTGTGLPRQ